MRVRGDAVALVQRLAPPRPRTALAAAVPTSSFIDDPHFERARGRVRLSPYGEIDDARVGRDVHGGGGGGTLRRRSLAAATRGKRHPCPPARCRRAFRVAADGAQELACVRHALRLQFSHASLSHGALAPASETRFVIGGATHSAHGRASARRRRLRAAHRVVSGRAKCELGSVRRNPAATLTSRAEKWGRDALSLRRAARVTKSPTNRARRRSRRDSRTRQRNGFRRKAREIDGDAAPRSIERGDARPRALFRVHARRRARASLYAHTVRARVTRARRPRRSPPCVSPETPTPTGSSLALRFRRARARRFRLERASARRFRRDRP